MNHHLTGNGQLMVKLIIDWSDCGLLEVGYNCISDWMITFEISKYFIFKKRPWSHDELFQIVPRFETEIGHKGTDR